MVKSVEVVIEAVVEKVEPGKLRSQKIATARSGDRTVVFDVIEGLLDVMEGEKLRIVVSTRAPANLDDYVFCGHGYLAARRDDRELLSLWGILFLFTPPIGLEDNVKYYLCIAKQ
jgi:DNA-directed RNA polymerase subunit G